MNKKGNWLQVRGAWLAAVAVFALAGAAQARIVTQDEAERAARLWAVRGERLGTRLGGLVHKVVGYSTNDIPAFYAVEFSNGGGTVFTSADTGRQPILAFAKDATAELDPDSPLAKLLYAHATARNDAAVDGAAKWQKVLSSPTLTSSTIGGMSWIPIESIDEIDDVRVAPFTQTKWAQDTAYTSPDDEITCYNRFTPVNDLVIKEYYNGTVKTQSCATVCGCVATAMAQVMKYWEYPAGERQSFTNTCSWPTKTVLTEKKDGSWYTSLEAYDEGVLETVAGAYDWANMTLDPHNGSEGTYITDENADAIGKLTYDCGVSVGMSYGIDGSGINSDNSSDIVTAFCNNFAYTNALLNDSYRPLSTVTKSVTRQNTILANLDAGCPVMLLVSGNGGGHAVVGDGYGYSGADEDAYVHLNMGWAGQCDVWYNLPYINAGANPENFNGFDTILGVVYNISPTNTYEIVSGRVTTNDWDGVAHGVADLVVTAKAENGIVYEATTSEYGVYAFRVPSGSTYHIVAQLGKRFGETWTGKISVSTGYSIGNRWGNDILMADPIARINGNDDDVYYYMSDVFAAAKDGDNVEILREAVLKDSVTLTKSITIVATNADASASAITRLGGASITVTNATLTLRNVVFGGSDETLVNVLTNGVVKLESGVDPGVDYEVGVSIRTANADGFVLAGALPCRLTLSCATAKNLGDVFGTYVCDAPTAKESADLILSGDDQYLETRGEADTATGKLVWKEKEEYPEHAAGYYVDKDGKTNAYARLDRAFKFFEAAVDAGQATNLLVRKSRAFTCSMTFKRPAVIEGLDGVTLSPSGTAAFHIEAGADVTITNLAFQGYVDGDSSDKYGFIAVEGGKLTLESGTILEDMVGRVELGSGVVDVLEGGTLTMREGASILYCSAEGGEHRQGMGGAIYVDPSASCTLNLEGGTIYGCWAAQYGGGVYVYNWYADLDYCPNINLSGNLQVWGNVSDNYDSWDDIHFANNKALSRFKLVGALGSEAWVGIRYQEYQDVTDVGNSEGRAFVTYADGIDPLDLEASGRYFFSDEDSALYGVEGKDNRLVWAKVPDNGTCPEMDASAHVVYPDNSVNHYTNLVTAIAYMTNGTTARIEMYRGKKAMPNTGLNKYDTLTSSVTLPTGCNLTLMAGEAGYRILRDAAAGVTIPAGTSLTVTNLVMERSDASLNGVSVANAFITVEGGSLTLANGAEINKILGNSSRDAGAITVYQGGMVTMLAGSSISGCENCYNYKMDFEKYDKTTGGTQKDYGCGGAILVDDGTAYLYGGQIVNCVATRGGGVYACNKSKVYVSGGMQIYRNTWQDADGTRNDGNVQIADKAELVLDGPLTGWIGSGHAYHVTGDATIAATVAYDWADDISKLVASASKFVHDDTGDMGVAVTNDTEAIIVWLSSLKKGEGNSYYYEDANGASYGAIEPGQCTAAEASVRVAVQGAGGYLYFRRLNHAFTFVDAQATFETRGKYPSTPKDWEAEFIWQDVVMKHDVVLTDWTEQSGGTIPAIWRDGDVQYKVAPHCTLVVSNLTFYGAKEYKSRKYVYTTGQGLFAVDGGTLTLATNATVCAVSGTVERVSNAITVTNGGAITMLAGSAVKKSVNDYVAAFDAEGSGAGIRLEDATAYFKGGKISGCQGFGGGAVYAGSNSTVYVSGDFSAVGNADLTNGCDNVVLATNAQLIVDGALTGNVGVCEGVGGNSNRFATVTWDWSRVGTPEESAKAICACAKRFVHDKRQVTAVAATNDTETILVWSDGVKEVGGVRVYDEDGKRYVVVDDEPAPTPTPTLLPTLTDAGDVAGELAKLDDETVGEKITTLNEYNDFANWAGNVEGGKESVAASSFAYVSYAFGTTNLFESTPAVEITEVVAVDGGLTLDVVVKDGEDAMAVASAKVAAMLEGTTDVSDWTSAGTKIDLKADGVTTDLTNATEKKVSFTVKPVGSPTKAFIRLKY